MNNTDFLKSCTTNVRVVKDVDKIQYVVYESKHATEISIPRAVTHFRAQNILCAAVKEQLWIFSFPDSEVDVVEQAGDIGLRQHDRGVVKSSTATDGRAASSVLLEAIEGSISHTVANRHSMVRIGSWQWLFSPSSEASNEGQSVFIRLQANLDSSRLYLTTTTHSSSWQPIRQLLPEQEVVIAPRGRSARLVSHHDSESENGVQRRKHVVGSDDWKLKVAEMLAMQGMHINNDDEWVAVAFAEMEQQEILLWPAKLCLAMAPLNQIEKGLSGQPTWRHWFGSSTDSYDAYRNPLCVAEEWYIDATERAKVPAGGVTGDQEQFNGHSSIVIADTPLAIASPYNQRLMDQQTAMSGIYPTPPDGMLPVHVATQQSTADATAGLIPSGVSTENGGISSDMQFGESSESPHTVRRHSMASPTAVQEYQPHSDDLFGDMGEMDFGANEVGDADFDYFDEPDEMVVDEPIETTDLHNQAEVRNDEAETMEEDSSNQKEQETAVNAEDDDDSRPLPIDQDTLHLASETNDLHMAKNDQDESPVLEKNVETQTHFEKPLSPFGIRERLLPMPIPASAVQPEDRPDSKKAQRSSTFGPVTFNENLDIDTERYLKQPDFRNANAQSTANHGPDISLPKRPKKPRPKSTNDPDSGVADMMDTESEEDSYESASSSSEDDDLPPRLPWHTKKRKRSSVVYEDLADSTALNVGWRTANEDIFDIEYSAERIARLLESMLSSKALNSQRAPPGPDSVSFRTPSRYRSTTESEQLPAVDELLELAKPDLVYVAQLVSEQAISVTPDIVSSAQSGVVRPDSAALRAAIQNLMNNAVGHTIPGIDECAPSKLALIKEPPPRPPAQPGKSNGMPRPPQRENSMHLGPDYFSIPPPFVRVQRSSDSWELLPPAVSFWTALGLAPAGGPKDIRIVTILPGNEHLIDLVRDFADELDKTYEGWKLGSVKHLDEYAEDMEDFQDYDDGMILVGLDEESGSLSGTIQSYAAACRELGEFLAIIGPRDPDRTLVVCMVDPFEDVKAQQCLSACFWLLYKAYRDNIPKTHRAVARSDLVLQILPVSLIASPDNLVLLDAQQMGSLAIELYDRCPPSSRSSPTLEIASSLPILAAPAVELASHPPKRIGFQLSAEPPSDLLYEGSVLHLSYAISKDEQWLTACWVDSTGRHQKTSSASLRGRSVRDVITEIWDQTLDVLSARHVTWRMFIATTEYVDISVSQCWKAVIASKPRKQMLHATLLSIHQDPSIQLSSFAGRDKAPDARSGQGAGFLTPATTPQGSTITVSPDAGGQSNTPLTPAPSETTTSLNEHDPDAHLVDLTDESWAMLLSPAMIAQAYTKGSAANPSSSSCLASGLLFKRGSDSTDHMESLGVNLLWDIRLRPNGAIDEGPVKQAEATLRDVLRIYRSLSLLGNLRGTRPTVGDDTSAMIPVHVTSAIKGAQALGGFVS